MAERVYRTAIYARLSRDDGDKVESNSIVSQRELCEDYIRRHSDLELVDTFVDDGYSGVNFRRPGFRKLEEAVREGKIEAVLCKDLSRFSRNYIEGGRYLEKIFPQLGVRFIAINDAYDTATGDPQSDSLIIPFKNLINDTYCKDISVKTRTNLEAKRRRGEYVGSYAPYGYVKDAGNKNCLLIDEYAGGIVRQIFSMYRDGTGIQGIADRLNQLGVRSPMEHKQFQGINYNSGFSTGEAARWSYHTVRRILTNEIYIGVLAQGKRGTPNYKVHVMQERDQSEWIRVEDAVPPLVGYEDFMSVRRMLGRDTRMTGEDSEANLFSGFVFCADCGMPMTRKVIPSKKNKYYYYVCSTNKRHEGCTSHSISTRQVQKVVTDAIRDQISRTLELSGILSYLEHLPDKSGAIFNYEAQMSALEEEIAVCKRRKLRLYEDFSDHMINEQEYNDFRKEYSRQIEEKEAALERVRRESREQVVQGTTERKWLSSFKKYWNLKELDRRVLMALVDKVLIYEGHVVEIVFRYRDEFQQAEEYVKNHADLIPQAI